MIDSNLLGNKEYMKSWIESHTDEDIKHITLERQIYSFFLLEKLIETDVEFIFKGGTALILLLGDVKRFSTDIDILISKPSMSQLEKRFTSFVSSSSIFTRFEEDIRDDTRFPKAHYKFFYDSIFQNDDQPGYILLDAVFEENPYLVLESKTIMHQTLPTKDPYSLVRVPSIADIMIDKLTAFAPDTIGVRFERVNSVGEIRDCSREVVKQWFDVNELYQKNNDFQNLNQRYQSLAVFEISHRELGDNYIDCLLDTQELVLTFLSKGNRDSVKYQKIRRGINRLNSFVNIPLNESYFISASVNVIELISRVLCSNDETYQSMLNQSKSKEPYQEYISTHQLKGITAYVIANNKNDRERFVSSMRVINEVFLSTR